MPIIVEATQKPKEAVEFAIDVLTKNCILSVNEGFVRERTEWTHQNSIDIGDIPAREEAHLRPDRRHEARLRRGRGRRRTRHHQRLQGLTS